MNELIDNNVLQIALILFANTYIVYNLMKTTLDDIDQTDFPDESQQNEKEQEKEQEQYTNGEEAENPERVPYPIAVPFISHMCRLVFFLLCLIILFLIIDIGIDIICIQKVDNMKPVFNFSISLKLFVPLLLSAIVCYHFNLIYVDTFTDKEQLYNKTYVKMQVVCLFIADLIIVTALFIMFQMKENNIKENPANYFEIGLDSDFIRWLKSKLSRNKSIQNS